MAGAKHVVREILREHGPLAMAEIVRIATTNHLVTSHNPKQTITNALSNDFLCQNTGEGRYAYLPTFIRQASMQVPMADAIVGNGKLRVPTELTILLWPFIDYRSEQEIATLRLTDVLRVEIAYPEWTSPRIGVKGTAYRQLDLPPPFWNWWQTQADGGADTLLVTCIDGEAGEYRISAVRSTEQDADAIATLNARVQAAAEDVLRRTRDGLHFTDLVRRLLPRGVYHHGAPAPLGDILFNPPGFFILEKGWLINFRPELTPAFRQLFAHRLYDEEQRYLDDEDVLEPLDEEDEDSGTPAIPATAVYRFKVSLQWMKRIWRVIEILDNQTLEDFHYVIQKAFGWDDDHLYAFYLSNRPFDHLTAVLRPTEWEYDPPHAHELMVGQLDLKVSQHILYIFDFGDDLRHDIELLQIVPLPVEGTFPRIVASQGTAPEQYPSWEDEDEEED